MTAFFKRISFWTKLKLFLGSCGLGTEVALHFGDSEPIWKYLTGGATIIVLAITYLGFLEDRNSNGIVDAFENSTDKTKTENETTQKS